MEAGEYATSFGATDFSWALAVPYIAVGFVSFAFFLGISEIIRLLNGINEKLSREETSG